jgi:NAD(P)-dependent dehydrogenase (short-subunit alcohol dehydrogenase family)
LFPTIRREQGGPSGVAGQPAELAIAYIMLADPLSSYVSGATVAVTGGKAIL